MKLQSHILTTILCTSSALCPLHAQDKNEKQHRDLINFKNDDLLHGKFLGFTTSGKVIWKNEFAEKNIAFERSELRKIVINKGELTKPFSHLSFIKLKNNDTIPGKITSMSDDKLTVYTDYCGELSIPSELISNIQFNPHGNQIIYRGPFSEEEKWELKYSEQYTPTKDKNEDAEDQVDENAKGDDEEVEEKKPDAWLIKNFSLQHQGTPGSIILKQDLPEKFRVTFHCYTSQSYYPAITLLADLNVPEIDTENDTLVQNRNRYKSTVASYLGSCLIVKPHSSGATISHYGFEKDGSIFQNNLNSSIRSSSSRDSHIKKFYDLRVDTTKGIILLYMNKKHIAQWDISDIGDKLKGEHFGFSMQYSSGSSKSIISDLAITKWHGITDSARSLENETRDIVMLANGTDRYSGKITNITDTVLELKADYAELTIPHEEISSVNFATKEAEALQRDINTATLRFYGTGKITGKISKAEDGYISLESETLGQLKVKSEYISSFEFIDMNHIYDAFN